MNSFFAAAKKLGYMKAGKAFKPLPKKGTKDYKKIMNAMKK